MKSTLFSLAAFAAVASVASADQLAWSAPITSTVWTAGSSQTVSWTNDCSDLSNTTYPIILQEQQGANQVPVSGLAPIGTLDCNSAGSSPVQIPATLPTGTTYSILVTNGDGLSYSAQFTINGVNPTTAAASTTAAATATATATTAATASGAKNATASATGTSASPKPTSGAGALKAGSTAALVIVAAVALML